MLRPREDRLFERYCRRGDMRALAAVFDQTAPEVWRVAAYLTHDPHLVEDAVQATFLAAIEHASRWDRRHRFVPWLLGILANQVRSLRRQGDGRLDPGKLTTRAPLDPVAQAEAQERIAQVRAALARVPHSFRVVLEPYLVDGEAPAEIAHRLGLRQGTARMRLQRGLAHLRRLLPAGFAAGSLVASVAPAAAMGSVRRAVLARATRISSTTATAGGSLAIGGVGLIGGILMKKLVFVITLAGALLWTTSELWERAGSDANSYREDPTSLRALSASPASAPAIPSNHAPSTPERTPLAAFTPGRGSLRVRVRDVLGGTAVREVVVVWRGKQPQTKVTDNRGECVFDDESGTGTLELASLEMEPFALGPDTPETHVVLAGEETLVQLSIDARVIAEVVVVDAAEQPVEGASVCGSLEGQQLPWYEALATTDARGRCLIVSTFARSVFAATDGRVPSKPTSLGVGRRKSLLTLRLGAAAGSVVGRVVNVDGTPAAHAIVAIAPRPAHTESSPPPPLCAHTDARGEFAVHGVQPGPCSVFAIYGAQLERRWRATRSGRTDGVVQATVPLEVVVQLGRGASVTGVIDTTPRDPARRLTVSAHYLDREGIPARIYDVLASEVTADAHGAFRVSDLLAGRYALFAKNEVAEVRHAVVLEEGATVTWNPQLAGGGKIALRVVDAEGKPIAACEVHANGRGAYASGMTDAAGRLAFDAASDSIATIAILRGVHVAAYFDDVRPGPQEHELRLADAHLPGAAHGRVVVEGGPLPPGLRAQLRTATPNRRYGPSAKIAADGSYRIDLVPPDTYRVAVTLDDAGGNRDEVVSLAASSIAPGATCDLGDLVVRARSRLRVAWPQGEEPTVYWLDDGVFVERRARRSKEGPLVSSAPVGRQEVVVWGETSAPVRTMVEIDALQESTLRPERVAATPCTFMFPEPLSRCAATLSIRDATSVMTFRLPETQARALRRGLLPGRYSVVVTDAAGQTWPTREITVGSQPMEVPMAPTTQSR